MDVFETYYKYNKFFFGTIGLWPYMDARTIRIRRSFTNVILTVTISAQLLKTLTSDYKMVIEILSNLIPCLDAVIVYITALVHQSLIKELIDQIRMDWKKIDSKEEYEIFEKYAKEARSYTIGIIVVWSGAIYSVTLITLLPILLDLIVPLDEPRPYDILMPMEMFFDTSKYFPISFTIVFICLTVIANASIAGYTFFSSIVQHSIALFELVGYIFENAIDENVDLTSNPDEEKKVYKRLLRGVWFHKRTIKFIDNVNGTSEVFYIIETAVCAGVIMFDIIRLLQLQMTFENTKAIVICIIHITFNLTWIFVGCFLGQKVIDNSVVLHTKLCNAKWYLSTTKVQKTILMVQFKTMKQSHVSIGKLFVASLEFYLSVVRSSFSYAMVCYSLRQ